MLFGLIQLLVDSFALIMQGIALLLPISPFVSINEMVSVDASIMQQVNYFLPLAEIVAALQIWVVGYLGYLIYMVIGRWVKLLN